ncbi:MAG: isoprenyl transferase [Bacteroidetes bacterium]|nr:isoprenyl transferase [Bacteroidota bacterium]
MPKTQSKPARHVYSPKAGGEDVIHQEEIKRRGNIPRHIAIIMDGNGRWAKSRNLPRVEGHRRGVESVRDIVAACAQLGVEYLTLFAFSTENWKRPKEEVSTLMRLLLKSLRNETDELHKNNIKLQMIGDFVTLPNEIRKELLEAAKKTEKNTKMTLNLALSYSGRWDILRAVKNITKLVLEKKLTPDMIDEQFFSSQLTTENIPDPDLLIRTSGEMRISNFLLWEIAYSEIFIADVFWPNFRRRNLYQAIENYQNRERRFGLVSEQITTNGNIQRDQKKKTQAVA